MPLRRWNVQVRLSGAVSHLSARPGSGEESLALFTVRNSYINRPTWVETRSVARNGLSESMSEVTASRRVLVGWAVALAAGTLLSGAVTRADTASTTPNPHRLTRT